MKSTRSSSPRRAFVRRPYRQILASGILALSAPLLHAATFTWLDTNSGLLNWSAGTWSPVAPTALDSLLATDLIFNGSGTTQYNAANNLAGPFLLNTLTLNSTATVTQTISGSGLSFNLDDAPAAITQSGSGAFTISANVTAASALTLNGAGTGLVSLTGAIDGTGLLTKAGGSTVLLNNIANSYSGGTTVTGGVLEVTTSVANGAVDLPTAGNSVLGNGGALTINGGELKISQNGTGSILSGANAARTITFGANGGTLNLNGRINNNAASVFSITMTPGGVAPVIKFNGGLNGLSSNNAADGNWVVDGNTMRINTISSAAANTPLTLEATNGATFQMSAAFNAFPGALTWRGVAGGDPTGQGNEKNTGRFFLVAGAGTPATYTFNSGLFLEGASQITAANALRQIDAPITVRGTGSGNAGNVAFAGRGTGTVLVATQAFPLVLGSATINGRTLTVENGGAASFDARIRTDIANQNGVQVKALTDIQAGGTVKVVQSWIGTGAAGGSARPAGYIEMQGDIRGSGTAASESVLEIQLPFRDGSALPASQNEAGATFNTVGAGGVDLIVNGSGVGEGGGLRIVATSRTTRGYTANNGASAGLAFTDTGATNVAKLNASATLSILAPARLAALTGSGGYLTIGATDGTVPFPAGGEWANGVTVGLKVTNTNTTGDDVSLSTGFVHNINLTANAALNAGGNTLGPAVATAGLGLIKGTGSILGGVTIAAGATLAPGFSIGTLTVGDITLNGTFQYEATSAPASDLLVVGGNLTLGGTSTLSLPGGNTYATADYTLATYSGTLAGTFGIVPALPANFTLSYGTGTNSTIKLLYTTPTDVWDGTVSGSWSTTAANWKTLAPFASLHKVVIDDTAAGPNTNLVINGGDVTPFNVTVNHGGVYPNYSITGSAGNAIIGTGSLTKNGTGTLTLSGPHTYSGGTTVTLGTLKLGASNSLPDSGAVAVAAGGVLDVNGMTDSIGALSVDGSVTAGNLTTTGAVTLGDGAGIAANLTLGGDVTKGGANGSTISGSVNLGGTRTFTIATGTAPELTLGGAVSSGALVKSGDGELLLNNAGNNYAGATTVNGGILRVGIAGALPAGTALTMNAGTLEGNDTAISLSSLSGVAGTTLNLGAGTLALAQAGSTSFAGNITGLASITKTLGGRLTLSGSGSNYSGGLFVTGGTVIVTNLNAPGSGTTTVNPGATFQVGASLINPILLQGGTLASQGNPGQLTNNELTAADGTTSTILLADSTNPATNSEAILLGILRGGGNLNIRAGTNNPAPDGGPGFRLRGFAASDFGGIITAGQSTKFEVQIANSLSPNPLGAAKIVLTAGTRLGALNGTYAQFQTRIQTGAETILFGNDIAIAGAGYVNYNALGAGDVTAVFGNLRIGGGQTLGLNKNDTNPTRTLVFDTVTFTGGNPAFYLFDPGFTNSATPGGAHLRLGDINETAASGVTFNGQAPYVTTLTGTGSYTGTTVVASGTLQVGAGGATGKLGPGLVIDNGIIIFNRNDSFVVPNDITGSGTVTNNGDPANILKLTGLQDYATLNASAGTTNVTGEFSAGSAAVNVVAVLNFGASQNIGSLDIVDGAVVNVDSALPPAPAQFAGLGDTLGAVESAHAVPEPGSLGLLLTGLLGLAARRLRKP